MALALPGCIVGEIRDELKLANQQLGTVQQSLGKLDTTNQSLTTTNATLGDTNQLIGRVQGGLGRIDTTNTSLGVLEGQLQTLKSVDASLVRLDAHLAGLRGTISKLDGVIPFLDLGAGDVPPPEEAAAVADASPVTEAPVPPPAEQVAALGENVTLATQPPVTQVPSTQAASTPATQTPVPREALVGTWLCVHPSRGGVLVILPDGKYVYSMERESTLQSGGPAGIERGTWQRTNPRTLLLQVTSEGSTGSIAGQSGSEVSNEAGGLNESTTSKSPGQPPSRTDAAGQKSEPAPPAEQGANQVTGQPAGQANEQTALPSGVSAAATPRTWKLIIISQSSRSFTAEIDGSIYVWTRP
jgi:hypothetical protein